MYFCSFVELSNSVTCKSYVFYCSVFEVNHNYINKSKTKVFLGNVIIGSILKHPFKTILQSYILLLLTNYSVSFINLQKGQEKLEGLLLFMA